MAVSKRLRRAVFERDDYRCQYCGLKFDRESTWNDDSLSPMIRGNRDVCDWIFLEIDHIHPRKHGGGDEIENLRAACSPCNRAKSATTQWVDWGERLRIAREILADGPDDQEKAEQVATVLMGYRSRSELPRPRFLFGEATV